MNDTIKSYQKQKFQKYKSKAWKSMAKYHDRTQTAQKLISEALRDKKKNVFPISRWTPLGSLILEPTNE